MAAHPEIEREAPLKAQTGWSFKDIRNRLRPLWQHAQRRVLAGGSQSILNRSGNIVHGFKVRPADLLIRQVIRLQHDLRFELNLRLNLNLPLVGRANSRVR